ncbi:MAG TPA: hypothetical protein PKK74_00535 [Candidatus Methanoculleus thermohydrogenotrophicum]|jgi:hypothetical protein|nr:hypothetical protein [Candidatus Methanoculleus thermohydrogenotrophicum]NLM81087.1 hypothetical protein [Candidatus Methanoculleus thermohydrogenotrophicum]HOB17171.1 hypothetical protein [Candidatus Methanoculleus thermohydrogenotrophicum]HPZ37250.1 hypothetical protein [Candidatus Methanoculleus thermohydrogenotrophicum]HQC90536.1 hypothetical protein [Candidatus Methanoculleus thermohydrogenotrophicum]
MFVGIAFYDRRIVLFDTKGYLDLIATVTIDRTTAEGIMAAGRSAV